MLTDFGGGVGGGLLSVHFPSVPILHPEIQNLQDLSARFSVKHPSETLTFGLALHEFEPP